MAELLRHLWFSSPMIITASKIDSPQLAQRSRKSLWFLCISFLLHGLIIGLLSQRNTKLPAVVNLEETKVIEATLIFPKLPDIIPEKSVVQQPIKNNEPSEPEQVDALDNANEQSFAPPSNPEPVQMPSDSVKTTTAAEPQRPVRALSSRGLTQRFMQQRNSEQLDALVEQEVKRYRKQLKSPDLNIPIFNPNAEQELQAKPDIVACDKTAAKIFAAIGNTMGGNMRCRDKPDINQFIRKRLDKK